MRKTGLRQLIREELLTEAKKVEQLPIKKYEARVKKEMDGIKKEVLSKYKGKIVMIEEEYTGTVKDVKVFWAGGARSPLSIVFSFTNGDTMKFEEGDAGVVVMEFR